MTKLKQRCVLVVATCAELAVATIGFVVRPLLGQQAPGLTMAQTSSNQVRIIITNGSSQVNYEIYRTPVLGDPAYPFLLSTNGTLGQTNFTINMGIDVFGCFRASIGSDWDGDGIKNWQDGNPSDANVGVLSITIDSPLHGT